MTDPQTMAEALLAAERDRTPIAPFSRRNPFLDASVGYTAQESWSRTSSPRASGSSASSSA